MRWTWWAHGLIFSLWLHLMRLRAKPVCHHLPQRSCCVFISFSSSLIIPTLPWNRHCTTRKKLSLPTRVTGALKSAKRSSTAPWCGLAEISFFWASAKRWTKPNQPCIAGQAGKIQGQHSGQGEASVSGDQVPVRASQNTLLGLAQEHPLVAGDVFTVELVDAAQTNMQWHVCPCGMSQGHQTGPMGQNGCNWTANSTPGSPCERSRIHLRFGEGYAAPPLAIQTMPIDPDSSTWSMPNSVLCNLMDLSPVLICKAINMWPALAKSAICLHVMADQRKQDVQSSWLLAWLGVQTKNRSHAWQPLDLHSN